ncbi:YigZ family protein [bacterium]|nr:YigZ family protein [bacterium]
MSENSYFTIEKESLGEYTDKGSRFIGVIFPLEKGDEISIRLDDLKGRYPGATHYVYAYRLMENGVVEVFRDCGEPSGTAGLPMINVLRKNMLTNTGIIVIRYFGGKKLGVSGLREAYTAASEAALANARILEKFHEAHFKMVLPYTQLDRVSAMIEPDLGKLEQKEFTDKVTLFAAIKLDKLDIFRSLVEALPGIELYELD